MKSIIIFFILVFSYSVIYFKLYKSISRDIVIPKSRAIQRIKTEVSVDSDDDDAFFDSEDDDDDQDESK